MVSRISLYPLSRFTVNNRQAILKVEGWQGAQPLQNMNLSGRGNAPVLALLR